MKNCFAPAKLQRMTGLLLIAVLILAIPPIRATGEASVPVDLLQFSAGGHALGFTPDGMYAATGSHALHVEFAGTRGVEPVADSAPEEGKQASPLGQVTYTELWPGISLSYAAAAQGIFATTYTLAPGADPADIRLDYNTALSLEADGTLQMAYETGALSESAPLAWQTIGGQRVQVKAAFRVRGQEVGFALGAYDPAQPLTIDPTLTWSTFLGGSAGDYGYYIAVDGSGNIYVAGDSDATWGVSPVRAYTGNSDAFVAKLFPTGGRIWNTFLGGSSVDEASGIAVDGSGNVYVAGTSMASWGSNIVVPYSAGYDSFAAKLDTNGNLTWNTFLGGSGEDYGGAVAVDGSGNVYVAGRSLATWGSHPVRLFTADDAFVAKLKPAGGLDWNTFLGGSTGGDGAEAITVDGSGNIYVAGFSYGDWGVSPIRAYTGSADAFVAELFPAGGRIWNTFLGGSGFDTANGIALDVSGNIYVAGTSDAPWGNPVRPTSGSTDTFAAKLSTNGSLTWNTFLGGSNNDDGYAIAVGGNGNVFVAGYSSAPWGNPSRPYSASSDGYAAQLSSTGSLAWNTFLGGSREDVGFGIAVDGSGNVYVAGQSNATWGSPVRNYTAGFDAFVVELSPFRIYLPLMKR